MNPLVIDSRLSLLGFWPACVFYACGAKGSIFSGKYDQFHTIRENIERKYLETSDLVPGLAERVLAGRRGDRLYAR